MDEFDKTKKTIGVKNLNEKTKKELFDKFVNAGGEVISEKQKRKERLIQRERQLKQKSFADKKNQRKKTTAQQTIKTKKTVKYNKPAKKKDSFFSKFINKLKIKIKLFMLKVTQFNGFYFNLKFLERFNNNYKPALMEIQMVYFDIFKTDLQSGNKIISSLDKEKPLFYEVIEQVSNIYDNITANQIVEHYISFPNVPQTISDLKDPLMGIFRKLYVLRPYESTILIAFDYAIRMNVKINEKKSSYYSQQRKKIKNGLTVLFNRLYPRLHWLFCMYEEKFFDIDDPDMEQFLGISENNKPGQRKLTLKEIEDIDQDIASAFDENNESEDGQSDNKDIPDHVKKGLPLIYNLDLKKLKKEFDKSEIFRSISNKDKICVTFILFCEFDKEYSCLLTTNKIKYRVDFNREGKLDFKSNLQNLYDQMRKCYTVFKDYAESTDSYIKLRREKPVSNTQYIQYTKRLSDQQRKRTQAAQKTREVIKSFIDKVASEFITLLDDMKNDQKYLFARAVDRQAQSFPSRFLDPESYLKLPKNGAFSLDRFEYNNKNTIQLT